MARGADRAQLYRSSVRGTAASDHPQDSLEPDSGPDSPARQHPGSTQTRAVVPEYVVLLLQLPVQCATKTRMYCHAVLLAYLHTISIKKRPSFSTRPVTKRVASACLNTALSVRIDSDSCNAPLSTSPRRQRLNTSDEDACARRPSPYHPSSFRLTGKRPVAHRYECPELSTHLGMVRRQTP